MPPQALKEYVLKEGKIFKTWKKRFLDLRSDGGDSTLSWLREPLADIPHGKSLLGRINLRGYSIVTDVPVTGIKMIRLHGSDLAKDRTLVINVETDARLRTWTKALTEHIAYADHNGYSRYYQQLQINYIYFLPTPTLMLSNWARGQCVFLLTHKIQSYSQSRAIKRQQPNVTQKYSLQVQ